MTLKTFALVPAFAFAAILAQAQSSQKITGTITDTMCGKKHMMQGEGAAQCTRDCVKEGSDYALISGDKVYTLQGDKAQFDKFAGTNVVVEGTTTGTTALNQTRFEIAVQSGVLTLLLANRVPDLLNPGRYRQEPGLLPFPAQPRSPTWTL